MILNNNEGLSPTGIEYKELIVREILANHRKDNATYQGIGTSPVYSTVDGFINAVKQLLDIVYADNNRKVMLKDMDTVGNVMQNPHNAAEELSGAVVYEMVRRAPGTMKGGNDWFSEVRREVKPRIRSIKTGDLADPYATVYLSQWFDNLLSFNVCARTAYRADELATEFENMMESYRFYFSLKGVGKYFLRERTRDVAHPIGNEMLYYRPLEYYVRTETTYTVNENTINKILMTLVTDS